MKKVLLLAITVFCYFIAPAQKIEFKKFHIYLNNKKFDKYECEEKDIVSQMGNPESREDDSLNDLNYFKKGVQFRVRKWGSKGIAYMTIYFKPFEKYVTFPGELWISGNQITLNTTVQDLKKMKGLEITEPEDINLYNDYKVQTDYVFYTFVYKRDGTLEWIEISF